MYVYRITTLSQSGWFTEGEFYANSVEQAMRLLDQSGWDCWLLETEPIRYVPLCTD
jgi:hypothetical protein